MNKKLWNGQWNSVAYAAVFLLAVSLLFGGASREHALRLGLVELAALPLIVLAGGVWLKNELWRGRRFAFSLLIAIAALPLIQIVPLPPALWTALPGREQLSLALTVADLNPGWSAMSVTPDRTWRSFLALLPPVAMFLAALGLSTVNMLRLSYVALGLTGAALALGVIQIASGGERFYPWATTAAPNMVGFFANRNHFATLLLMTLPLAAVIAGAAFRRRSDRTPILGWLAVALIGVAIVALAVIRSRAGVILGGPALVLSLLAAWIASGRGRPNARLLTLVGVATAAVCVIGVFALAPVVDRFDSRGQAEGRFENWPTVAEAAQTYLPVGSGLGSFDAVYRSVEPLERLDATFFNQAHNEYLEIWLEAGIPGIMLIIAFVVWWARRTWTCWRSPPSTEADLQRAASLAVLFVLLHSVADYPMRTETIAVLFALCAAVLERANLPATHPARHRDHSEATP